MVAHCPSSAFVMCVPVPFLSFASYTVGRTIQSFRLLIFYAIGKQQQRMKCPWQSTKGPRCHF